MPVKYLKAGWEAVWITVMILFITAILGLCVYGIALLVMLGVGKFPVVVYSVAAFFIFVFLAGATYQWYDDRKTQKALEDWLLAKEKKS